MIQYNLTIKFSKDNLFKIKLKVKNKINQQFYKSK